MPNWKEIVKRVAGSDRQSGRQAHRIAGVLRSAARWCEDKSRRDRRLKGRPVEEALGRLLAERGETVSLAESCTGGLAAHLLTNVAGSSDYFVFSAVTYSNRAKVDVLGVSSETLKKYGAVHERTAEQMAAGAKRVGCSTYGLSTTGIAGPSGGTGSKPVGTVCIGLATPEKTVGRRFVFSSGDRAENKAAFAMQALQVLLDEIRRRRPPGK